MRPWHRATRTAGPEALGIRGRGVTEAPRSRSAAETEIKRPAFPGVHKILRFKAEELTGLTPTDGHDSAEYPPR